MKTKKPHLGQGRLCGAISGLAMTALIAFTPMAATAEDLTVSLDAEITQVDPHFTGAYITRVFSYMVYDTLFAMDSNGDIQPQMVDTYTVSDDMLTWTFTLRDGLSWHDGAPVTAADCIASLQRWASRSPTGGRMFDSVDTIVADSDKTFTITMKAPYGLVLETLGTAGSPGPFMLPERLANVPGSEQLGEVVGSGPFKYDPNNHVSGDRMILTKNEAYVPRDEPADFLAGGKHVYVDRLIVRVMPDQLTETSALQAGELDYSARVPIDLLPIYEADPNLHLEAFTGLNLYLGQFRMNSVAPPLNRPEMRRIVQLAVHQPDMLAAIGFTEGFGQECFAFFGCNNQYSSEIGTEVFREASLENAQAALRASDYANEPVVVLIPTDNPVMRAANEVLAERLRQVGFNVDAQSMDWASVIARRQQKEGWNIAGISNGNLDNISPLTNPIISFNCREGFTSGFFCIEEIVPLVEKYVAASTVEERKQYTDEIQKIVYVDHAMTAYYGQFSLPAAWSVNLKGVLPSVIPVFWNISK